MTTVCMPVTHFGASTCDVTCIRKAAREEGERAGKRGKELRATTIPDRKRFNKSNPVTVVCGSVMNDSVEQL